MQKKKKKTEKPVTISHHVWDKLWFIHFFCFISLILKSLLYPRCFCLWRHNINKFVKRHVWSKNMALEYGIKTVILLLVVVAVFTAAMGLPVPIGMFRCLMWNCSSVYICISTIWTKIGHFINNNRKANQKLKC